MSFPALLAYYRTQAERFGTACRFHLILIQWHPDPRPGALDLWTDEATTTAQHAAHYARLSTTEDCSTERRSP
jgi:hypothetical protein